MCECAGDHARMRVGGSASVAQEPSFSLKRENEIEKERGHVSFGSSSRRSSVCVWVCSMSLLPHTHTHDSRRRGRQPRSCGVEGERTQGVRARKDFGASFFTQTDRRQSFTRHRETRWQGDTGRQGKGRRASMTRLTATCSGGEASSSGLWVEGGMR